jgi:shikimate dehydrogenase
MSAAARPLAPAYRRFLAGLIGAPIAHSASPAMHERAAEAFGDHSHYQLIEVAGVSCSNSARPGSSTPRSAC